MSTTRQRAAFAHLLQSFEASAGQPSGPRWRYLEAAHVLGQNVFALHWRAHWHMLRFARQLGDREEARGQLGHLAMAPVGHLVRRLPQGNIGRAYVGAMQNMMPSAAVRACITAAMQATQPPQDGAQNTSQNSP